MELPGPDERDSHRQTNTRLEGEDTTPLLGRIEALERALRVGHSSATHDPPSVTSPAHGRQLIMTNKDGSHVDVILWSVTETNTQCN